VCPIKGESDILRPVRIGKIRLGLMIQEPGKKPHPKATNYFVVPDSIKQYTGPEPKTLKIMFPTDNPEEFAPQYLKLYHTTQGLVCKGDGTVSRRKVDMATGAVADHNTQEWTWRDMTCNKETCPEYLKGDCRRNMNLMFLMPDVPGIGVWQLDTSSFWSHVNVNSCIELIRSFTRKTPDDPGHIRGIPLVLSLEAKEVTPPGQKKKTVQVLQLRSDAILSDLQAKQIGSVQVKEIQKPDDKDPPEDLTTRGEITTAVVPKTPAGPLPKVSRILPRAEWDKFAQSDIPDYLTLETVFMGLTGLSNRKMYIELGGGTRNTIGTPVWDAFLTLKNVFAPANVPEKLFA
jgi:hypothetical protein